MSKFTRFIKKEKGKVILLAVMEIIHLQVWWQEPTTTSGHILNGFFYSAFIVLVFIIVYKWDLFEKIRCPNCGSFVREGIDKEQLGKDRIFSERNKEKLSIPSTFSPENLLITCIKCKHKFRKFDAEVFKKVAKRFGNKITIAQYQKQQKEIESEDDLKK